MQQDLILMSPLCHTGYGIAGLNIAKALDDKVNLYLCPPGLINTIVGNSEQETTKLKKHVLSTRDRVPYEAPCLNIWHQFDLLKRYGRGPYFALPFFELDTFSEKEKYHLAFPDKIIVASEWAKKVVEDQVPQAVVHVAPMGVDSTIFKPAETTESSPYIFFNAGKWEKRKGHDILWKAFDAAFKKTDDVELWMMPHNPFLTPQETAEWTKQYKTSQMSSKIKLLPQVATQNEVATFMRQVDCGVFPSRAEGWNLELLEMMACNKPVITTFYSAHTQYCNERNSQLIDIEGVEEAYDGKWFHGQGSWAEFGDDQFDQLVHYMRVCYEGRLVKNPNGLQTARELTWENTANKLMEIIYA